MAVNDPARIVELQKLSALVRYHIITATTKAGSGHPTSSLSAVELMVGLMFGGTFRYDLDHPEHPNNDRLIFSKGHASPLFYALWLAADRVTPEQMGTYRQFGSPLEGHPTRAFRYTEAATGSLGQGLAIGLGMALNARYLDKLPYRTYVLLGDSEMAEGSQWEAMELAAHYGLGNLVGVLDVNRLGQRGETMHGHDLAAYERRAAAFGWETIVVDGHDLGEVTAAYERVASVADKPIMIIARTIKGQGVPEVADRNGFHGKALDQEQCDRAIAGLGEIDQAARGTIPKPAGLEPERSAAIASVPEPRYEKGKAVATRTAYGNALARLYPRYPALVALDGEVGNSTMTEIFAEAHASRFFEMYIAEQSMVGAGLGLAIRGQVPFVATFAAFLSRAHDQIRMSQYSDANLKIVGSHAGVSIGEDGPSQMALEDLAMFRSMLGSVVLYPADAYAAERLVEEAIKHQGIVYVRTTRAKTPIIYGSDEVFPVGGCKVLAESADDHLTIVAAGITLHEALKAHNDLLQVGITTRVIDLYSVKPVDVATLTQSAHQTGNILVVEDHYPEGGMADAVREAVGNAAPVYSLAVRQKPRSGKPDELLDYEGISRTAIVARVREIV